MNKIKRLTAWTVLIFSFSLLELCILPIFSMSLPALLAFHFGLFLFIIGIMIAAWVVSF